MKFQYENFIKGRWVPPLEGRYLRIGSDRDTLLYRVPRSTASDVNMALDSAHEAKMFWRRLPQARRNAQLEQIAIQMRRNDKALASLENRDKDTPLYESLMQSLPVAINHFRSPSQDIVVQLNRPMGGTTETPPGSADVIKLFFPVAINLADAAHRIASALSRGHCIVICLLYLNTNHSPRHLLALTNLASDLLRPGVLNVVNGLALEVGAALVNSKRAISMKLTQNKPIDKDRICCQQAQRRQKIH